MLDTVDPDSIKPKLQKSVDFLIDQLKQIRTDRANVSLVEHIEVEAYGTKMPINQLATISIPDPRTILITPWDKSNIEPIVKAIQTSNLGINPVVLEDGIKLVLPPMTAERRQELIRIVKQEVENARVAIRNIRKEWMKKYDEEAEKLNISKEERRKVEEKIDRIVGEFNEQVNKIGDQKESELSSV